MIKQILQNLYLGDEEAFLNLLRSDDLHDSRWNVIQACKTWHAKVLGYNMNQSFAVTHPDSELWTEINDPCRRLVLNLVDARRAEYIPCSLIDKAIKTLHQWRDIEGKCVLVHCDKGISRSSLIAMLYCHLFVEEFKGLSLAFTVTEFQKLYPLVNFGEGAREFLLTHWQYHYHPERWKGAHNVTI